MIQNVVPFLFLLVAMSCDRLVVKFTPAKLMTSGVSESVIGIGDDSVTNTNSVTFGGSCLEDMGPVRVSGADRATTACTSGSWSYTVATQSTDASRSYSFSQENNSSITMVTRSWTRDTTGPVISSFLLKAGAATTINLFNGISSTAQDPASPVTEFCVQLKNPSQPAANHSCWRQIADSNKSVSLTNEQIRVDFDVGIGQTVYLWMRDRLGNVSGSSRSITYSAATPPTIGRFDAVNTDFLGATAPSFSDTTFTALTDVVIKWNVSDLAPGFISSIKLQYTLDEVTWTTIPGAGNLSNTQGSGCTNFAVYTGCFVWPSSAPAGYFRVRIIAADDELATTQVGSLFLNNTKVKLLAGRLDSGYGSHASSNIFNYKISPSYLDSRRMLAVNNEGTMYVVVKEGILRIEATTGISEVWIKETGTSSGDGGPAASATLKEAFHIDLDAQNNLYIFEKNRIRKVNHLTGIITTVVGGGGSTAATVVGGLNLQIDAVSERSEFTVLNNGDIIFTSVEAEDTGPLYRYNRHYHASSDTVTSIHFNVTGSMADAPDTTTDISTYTSVLSGTLYDPSTNEISQHLLVSFAGKNRFSLTDNTGTGTPPDSVPNTITCLYSAAGIVSLKDGQIYSNCGGKIRRFNPSTKDWTRLAGTGASGTCVDGTDALLCDINAISVFKTYNGYLYFIDNNLIRTIDSLGKVHTVYGQAPWFGDGGSPLAARFGDVSYFGINKSNAADYKIQTNDVSYTGIREFDFNGTLISRIAGPGNAEDITLTVGASILGNYGVDWSGGLRSYVLTDSSTGDPILLQKENTLGIIRANRGTGLWEAIAGGGGSTMITAVDGQLGSTLNLDAQDYIDPIGYNGSNFILKFSDFEEPINHVVKIFDQANGRISHLMGAAGASSSYQPLDCVDLASCNVQLNRSVSKITERLSYDSFDGTWVGVFNIDKSKIRRFTISGNPKKITTLSTVVNLPDDLTGAFAVEHDATYNNIYYVKSDDNKLYKRTFAGVETLLDFEVPDMLVKSNNIEFVKIGSDRMLVFIFEFDGRKGFAAYML